MFVPNVPTSPDVWIPADHAGVDDNGRDYVELCGGQRILNVHQFFRCKGRPCPIHTITDHHMNAWPQKFTMGGMARVCVHGIVHPDPDDTFSKPDHVELNGARCDGCCDPEHEQESI